MPFQAGTKIHRDTEYIEAGSLGCTIPGSPPFRMYTFWGLSVLTTQGCGEHVVDVVKARSHRSVCGPSGWRTTANLFLKAIGFTVETQRDITQWRSLRVAKIHQETTRQRSTQSSCQIRADAPLGDQNLGAVLPPLMRTQERENRRGLVPNPLSNPRGRLGYARY